VTTRARAGQAPGVIKVRLTGSSGDVQTAAALLAEAAELATGPDLIETSRPDPNRREPGERVYLTFRLATPTPPGQPPQPPRPALPSRRPRP
jgi:hypothetical protein